MFVLRGVGHGLLDSGAMAWQTLWALVVGFSLSGALRGFLSTRRVGKALGRRGPKALVLAATFGMVSSSCSYAAAAEMRALHRRGAHLVTAAAFLVASTNLVVELAASIFALLGWRFFLSELVGGAAMVAVVGALGPLVLRDSAALRAAQEDGADDELRPGRRDRIVVAARFAVTDAKMIRKELLVGYLLAGFAASLVPTSFWRVLLASGHGTATTLENALVGPIIACLSSVCSIGNVPLAAALWSRGAAFGGVVAFLFADLLALPLLLVYRRYFGTSGAIRLGLLLYAAAVIGGLFVDGLFSILRLAPHPGRLALVHRGGAWTATSIEDGILVFVAIGVYIISRRPLGSSTVRYRTDPVCGMQVRVADAAARLRTPAGEHVFCSESCWDRFFERETELIRLDRSERGAPPGEGAHSDSE